MLVYLLDDALLVFELIDVLLELLIEHSTIGNDNHRVEHPLVVFVVEVRQPMGKPGDLLGRNLLQASDRCPPDQAIDFPDRFSAAPRFGPERESEFTGGHVRTAQVT